MERRTQRLARVLIWLVATALLVYVTLDTVYFHVFFSAGNAAVVGLIQLLVVLVAIGLLLSIQLREKQMQPYQRFLHA